MQKLRFGWGPRGEAPGKVCRVYAARLALFPISKILVACQQAISFRSITEAWQTTPADSKPGVVCISMYMQNIARKHKYFWYHIDQNTPYSTIFGRLRSYPYILQMMLNLKCELMSVITRSRKDGTVTEKKDEAKALAAMAQLEPEPNSSTRAVMLAQHACDRGAARQRHHVRSDRRGLDPSRV